MYPSFSHFSYYNKLLFTLSELQGEQEFCSHNILKSAFMSTSIGGFYGGFEDLLTDCINIGLIRAKRKDYCISLLGKYFMNANRERQFELTHAQVEIIIEKIIFTGLWMMPVKTLLLNFHLDQKDLKYKLSKHDDLIEMELLALCNFLIRFKIIEEKEDYYFVVDRYSRKVYDTVSDYRAIGEQQLEALLIENKKLGTWAENKVLEFEKSRLNALGKLVQSDLTKKISHIDTAAGYDLISFNGNNDAIIHDRFIEVKATSTNDIRFYWTANERRVANIKANEYWIYLLISVNHEEESFIGPIMINNPAYTLESNEALSIEANKYLITAVKDVNLIEENLGAINWLYLV